MFEERILKSNKVVILSDSNKSVSQDEEVYNWNGYQNDTIYFSLPYKFPMSIHCHQHYRNNCIFLKFCYLVIKRLIIGLLLKKITFKII